jgi:carboxyl-terminal processing protease
MKRIYTLCLALTLFAAHGAVPAAAQDQAPAIGEVPLDEIRTFTEVFAKVKNDYVEQVDDRTLLQNAIRGMLEGLDPHSAFLDREAYLELQEGTTGEFGGLGIEVGVDDGFIKVIAPIDDTPAYRAGVQAGDVIIRLDDTPLKGMSLNDAVKLMRGKPGTQITLTIMRQGEEKPVRLVLTRDVIKVRSVRARMLEPGFGYVRISNFQSHTADDVRRELDKLKTESSDGLKGVILDLRNNPGGILSAAVAVSDLFLNRGLIVYTEGRVRDSKLRFNAKPSDMLEDAPLVVLVNAGSASASEIVAGALQDQKRAVIMGQKTFGKGSVQTILPMADESALKLTTARYYTPSGRSIQAHGIVPDIVIDQQVVVEQIDAGPAVTEANLSRHLENDRGGGEGAAPAVDSDGASLAGSDYALYEALNVLKGMTILQRKSG